jgi:hypothetical protein
LRETEVQQPNTASTSSTSISSRAFSANSGQSEAGSTTTASSGRPSRPPASFCSSMSISMTSFSVVSEIAMVPDSECRMPTLMSAACTAPATPRAVAAVMANDSRRRWVTKLMCRSLPLQIRMWNCQPGGMQRRRNRRCCYAGARPSRAKRMTAVRHKQSPCQVVNRLFSRSKCAAGRPTRDARCAPMVRTCRCGAPFRGAGGPCIRRAG